jgi:hypothetical protein
MFLAFGLQFVLVYYVSQRIITVHNDSFNVFFVTLRFTRQPW